MSSTSESSDPKSDIAGDTILWRNKKQSLLVLLASTATWVLLEVYQFNFVTVISWTAMFITVLLFLWGNVLRLLGKGTPNLPGLEISERSAVEAANSIRAWVEEGIRWMFKVAAEGDSFLFAGTVAGLWMLSRIGNNFDLLTLLYVGIVAGMTVPVIYVKYEDNIKRYGERVKEKSRRYYDLLDEKVVMKMKHKVVGTEEKEEKVE